MNKFEIKSVPMLLAFLGCLGLLGFAIHQEQLLPIIAALGAAGFSATSLGAFGAKAAAVEEPGSDTIPGPAAVPKDFAPIILPGDEQ